MRISSADTALSGEGTGVLVSWSFSTGRMRGSKQGAEERLGALRASDRETGLDQGGH